MGSHAPIGIQSTVVYHNLKYTRMYTHRWRLQNNYYACASEVYGSVFVCLCRLLRLLKDESSASRVSIGF